MIFGLLCLAFAGTCLAEGYSWTNTVSGVWSVSANWTNEVGAAVAPASGGEANYALSFNKAGIYTATHDLNNGFLLNQLRVGGPTLTLAGNSVTFTNNDAVLPQLNQNGSSALTVSNNLVLAANTILGGSGSGQVTLHGRISGSGSLTKTNASTLTINYGTNTFSGGTSIQAGTVTFQSFGVDTIRLLGTGPVTLSSNGTLALNRTYLPNPITFNGGTVTSGNSFSSTLSGPITLAASPTFNITGGISVTGNMSGPGGFIKMGNSTLPLSGSNSFTGTIVVNAGTLRVASLNSVSGGTAASNLGAPADAASGTISLGSGGAAATLIYNGPGETSDRVIKLAGATGGATLTQSGSASGLPATRGTSGLLKFTSNLSAPGTAGVDNRKTLTLTHATDGNTGGTPGQGEISGSIGDSLLGTAGQRATSVTKAGVGTWTLSGMNTYSGTTRIQAGTLAFTRADALGTNALDITDSAKAQLDYIGTRLIGALTFNAGSAQPHGSYGSSSSLATYKDDAHFLGLGTVTVGMIASPTTTTLALTSGANPSDAGVVLTFTATVSGAAPTGSVIFYDGVTPLGTNVLNGSFQASVSISTLAAGTHTLTALYMGAAGNASSASGLFTQILTEARPSTTTTLARTSGDNPSAKGAAVTLTATVAGASPSGTVTFYDGTASIGSATLNGSSQGSLAITSLAPGWHPITARYAGDINNAPSASTPPLVQTVNPSSGNGKVKVFILAGQSNMVGKGNVENGRDPNNLYGASVAGGLGSLRNMLNSNPDKYGYLADPANPIPGGSPGWMTRPDVWITYYGGAAWAITPPAPTPPYYATKRKGNLDANFGQDAVNGLIGPEYGFGLIVGSQLADQVLIIKYAHGGRSLAVDFRPPTSVLNSGGTVGPCYSEMIGVVHQVIDNIAAEFPAYAGGGYEVAGLGWHQGWNDRITASYVAEYETNMVNLIKDLRAEFAAPNMLVSIANTGMANADSDVNARNLITAQGNVANPTLHPEFAGTVATVDTRFFDFGTLRGANDEGYHWNWSGESYFNIGESMGKAMVALFPSTPEVPNIPPLITEGSVTNVVMSEDASPVPFSLTLNASDSDGGTLAWAVITNAQHGTVAPAGAGASWAVGYTPLANYNGSDSFAVQVSDGQGGTDTIIVNVTIQPVNDGLSVFLQEDFENEWADNALANTTNNWTSSGLLDRSSITNPAVGYVPLPLGVPFPLVYDHAASRRVLKVDTQGDPLSTPVFNAVFDTTKMYVDMMAKFGVSADLPVAVSNDVTAKASVFLQADGATTNLVVFHGQKTGDGFGAPVFTAVASGFDPEMWCRLTVTLDATTNNGGAEAFSVRINGEPLVSPAAYSDTWKTQIFSESYTPDGGRWFLSASRRLGSSGTNLTTFTGLTFDGEGFVDDLVVTPYPPAFAQGTVIMLALCTGSNDL